MSTSSTTINKSIGTDRFAFRKRKNDRNEKMRMIMGKNEVGMEGKFWNERTGTNPFTCGSFGKG
jgi:hypothetical protein